MAKGRASAPAGVRRGNAKPNSRTFHHTSAIDCGPASGFGPSLPRRASSRAASTAVGKSPGLSRFAPAACEQRRESEQNGTVPEGCPLPRSNLFTASSRFALKRSARSSVSDLELPFDGRRMDPSLDQNRPHGLT